MKLLATVLSAALLVGAWAPVGAQAPTATPSPGDPYADTGAIPGSGAELTIGYLPPGADDPSAALVTQGIREEAAAAGATLMECGVGHVPIDPVACARALAVSTVDGVLTGQPDPDLAGAVCAALGDRPTVAIEVPQPPCQKTFVSTDDRAAGRLAGQLVGAALLAERTCRYDRILAVAPAGLAEVGGQRLEGLLQGFASVCGPIPDASLSTLRPTTADGLAGSDAATLLAAVPPDGIAVVLAADDPIALDALAVAQAAGRGQAVRIGALGADPIAWPHIACDPVWIGDAGLFPERVGRTVVPAVIDLVNGQDVPPVISLPTAVVDAQTIRSFYPDVPAC